jgi:hypothetical protein
MSRPTFLLRGTAAHRFVQPFRRRAPQPAAPVAPGTEPVKAAPPGPPTAGPDGPTLTEPAPSAEESLRSAGMALPTVSEERGSQCP